ncbi:WecB/TagA/CpsF family glycosyltransferase [Methylorubrum extorquens]|jgi:exopolysaccharide biosynthesis WecB/TagA/CpsF family protein|uniref:WecB/TagA/CpsF family glycosyltransferase n=1 Tax=Methylorubrum extorquens TaxID=408 RepID=UPI0022383B34|nr:WecB/TagA/CpsF family glycosyltransferase [Methylorubrum extorquens]UYW26641.1 WecB/TagA/CpsF family glycosyltransferase [Methylorubrum extorquens]
MTQVDHFNVCGINITNGRREDIGAIIDAENSEGRKVNLAFCNAHTAEHAFKNKAFMKALNRMLVVNDGIGIEIAARINNGRGFKENLNGTDFIPWFLGRTSMRRRIFLIGAQPHVVSRTSSVLADAFPQHRVVGVRDGYFDVRETDDLMREVERSGADTLLVALGNPRQEIFMQQVTDRTKVKLAIGVGALFDFMTGEAIRAPRLVRRMRLEWFYRLAREPARMARRYLVGTPYVLGYSLRYRLAQSFGGH